MYNYSNQEMYDIILLYFRGGCLMLMYDSDDEVDKFNQNL